MPTANPILLTDSYKPSHYPWYPSNTDRVYSYFEALQGVQP